MFDYLSSVNEKSPWYSQRSRLAEKIRAASDRAYAISKSEEYLGYTETARQYAELAAELQETRAWLTMYEITPQGE